ncbi:MAG TPA: MotA/TolQ/ExbB proton channel family protein [Gemmatimonadaceae bacterium]|nr:MotA/TolQ/ExbB proton channel family protein [Gemmatimonadaceae bacterium]
MIGYFQVGRAVPTTTWELISHATLVTQVVLVILILLSVFSWAVMVLKLLEFRRVDRAAQAIWREMEHIKRFDEVRALARRAMPSPFSRILRRALSFLGELRGGPLSRARAASDGEAEGGVATEAEPLTGSQVEALRLVLDSETVAERDRLSRYIATLAVIGSASPLLGLLGTVIGIISAFLGIAREGAGNLGAVAPGVAEALIATAAALSVAIPAVFGYNIFASRLNRVDGELEAFGTEIIAVLVREGHI